MSDDTSKPRPDDVSTCEIHSAAATPSSARARYERGASLGRYVVLGTLGEGGMGVVLAAYDRELDRRVALKLLRSESGAPADEVSVGRARLVREAQAMARITHPNVLAIHDVGTFEQDVFIAMDLVRGGTLRQWLDETRRSAPELLAHFVLAGRGLAAAHAAGLVHRDFKPGNVLVGDDGRVLVTDFGIARALGAAPLPLTEAVPAGTAAGVERAAVREVPSSSGFSAPLTQAGVLVGTLPYMPPEQLRAENCDGRTDQYAFCVALYQALFGVLPFDAQHVAGYAFGAPAPEVRAPRTPRRLPARVRRAILRGLSLEVRDRFPSMDALLRELSWDPQARRRRLLTAGLVLSSVLVLGGAAELTRRAHASREAQLCSGAREALGDVWSSGRAVALERAFSATAAPFAAQAWRRTREALDGYSTQWLLAHRQACEATRRRGEQSEAVMMLRMACLHQRRTQLGAVVQVLGEADREVVEKADQVTAALPSLAGCADVGALTTLAEPPAGAAAQAELEALRRALARGVAEQEAGRYEASQATLEPLVARAQALGYAPLSAEVLTAFGTLTETRGLKGPACERLRQAIVLAERGNAQEQRVRAQIEAMIAFANFGRFDEAWVWADLAEAFLARSGRSDATFVDWAAAAGWVASQQGRYADAVAHYQRAMEAGDKLSPYPQLWRVYSRAGVALSHAGRGADGLATLQRAEALLVERLGADHPQRAFVLLNTSLVHMDEDRPAQAAAVLERAVELAAHTMAKPTSGVATIHANLAAAYFELQRYDEGLAAQAKALAISDELGDVRNRGLARLNQAHVLVLLARFPEALEASRLALKDFEQTVPDDHEYVADGLSWRGAAALELGQRAQAVGDLERALAWFENPARTTTRYDVNASNVRFLLARALWPDANQRQRSRGLAGEALRGYEAAKSEPEAERVRAWLARPR